MIMSECFSMMRRAGRHESTSGPDLARLFDAVLPSTRRL